MPIAPEMGRDFETAWNNFANRLKNLEGAIRISASQQGIVVPVSTTPGGGGPTGPPQVPGGPSPGIDPVTGKPLPGTPPIIIQQGVLPVTDLVVTPGAYLGDVYAEVTWQVSELSNAIAFDVEWGTPNPDGTINLVGSYRTSGNSFRLSGLQPNTEYGVQVTASNMLGQSLSTPAGSYYFFLTTTDSSVPPAPSNGPVQVGAGATSVIVSFQPLTAEQAPDVANGNGVYDIQVTNDPTFTKIIREIRTAATVVSFNDIYPSTTLPLGISIVWGPGTNLPFADLSMLTPGQPFKALVDSEFISFNAPVGNSAVISARNSGTAPLAGGAAVHAVGATAVFQTQTVWYARVSAIDASGNQGSWATSSGGVPAGSVTDSMLVGDLNAAHITFGTMRGDRIEANSMQVSALAAGTILATTIALGAGGQFTAGNPPTTGMVLNSQGMTLYNAGAITASFNATTGGSTIIGGVIASGSTPPRTIVSNNTPSWVAGGASRGGGLQFDMGATADGGIYAGVYPQYTASGTGKTGVTIASGGNSTYSSYIELNADAGINISANGSQSIEITPTLVYIPTLTAGTFTADGAISLLNGGYQQQIVNYGGAMGFQDGVGNIQLYCASVDANGTIYSSDRKLKSNIEPLGDSSFIYKLKPKVFNFKTEMDRLRYGFIAQEVEKVAPDFVVRSTIHDNLGLDYVGLIAPLIDQVQKLDSRLKSLEKAST